MDTKEELPTAVERSDGHHLHKRETEQTIEAYAMQCSEYNRSIRESIESTQQQQLC